MFHVKHLYPLFCIILLELGKMYSGDNVLKICISSQNKPLYAAVCARLSGKACIFENHSLDCNILIASPFTVFNGRCDVCLVDGSELPHFEGSGKIVLPVSCGMGEKDTVTFSSIDYDRAVLCVQRNVKLKNFQVESGEFPVIYDQNLSVWHNLAVSFCIVAADRET